jgi:hypothetical protein
MMTRLRVESGRTSRVRRRWWVAGAVLVAWTLAAWYAAASSHRAYERCESHPGPGIGICTDWAPLMWVFWAIPVILSAFVLLVVVVRRTITSVDAQVEDDQPNER